MIRNILLGIGLAMDAFAVSIANGMKYKRMSKHKMLVMSLFFAFFQGGMPLIGYWLGKAIFRYIEVYLPWIALFILGILGLNMLLQSFDKEESSLKRLTITSMLLQAIATSIDALSVGIPMAGYTIREALLAVTIIFGITLFLSFVGILIGKKFGIRFKRIAEGLGGIILIGIGIEIFLKARGI